MSTRRTSYAQRIFEPFVSNKFLLIPLLWHAVQIVFVAFNLRYAISPDEDHHFKVIELYSRVGSLRLEDTVATLKYGVLSVYPYLYHRILGFVFPLVANTDYSLLFLRLLNVCLSIGLFVGVAHLCKKLTSDKWPQVLCLVLLANIPMLQLLGGAISYDNAVNFLSVVLLLQLLTFWDAPGIRTVLLVFNVFMLGALVKITFLPWVVVIVPVVLIAFIRKSSSFSRPKNYSSIFLPLLCFVILFALNLDLYGKNIFKYRRIVPFADQVVGYETAFEHFPIFKRNSIWKKEGETKELLAFSVWFKKYLNGTMQSTLGIQGHRNVGRTRSHLNLYQLAFVFFLISCFIFFYRVSKKKSVGDLNFEVLWILSFASAVYALFVIHNNYNVYANFSRSFGTALQGRYLFPAVIAFSPVFSVVLLAGWPTWLRRIVFSAYAILFTYSGCFYLVQQPKVWNSVLEGGAVWDKVLEAEHAYFSVSPPTTVLLSQNQRDDGLAVNNNKLIAQELILPKTLNLDSLELFLIEGQKYHVAFHGADGDLPGEEVDFEEVIPDRSGFYVIPFKVSLPQGRVWLIVSGGTSISSDIGTSAPGTDPYQGELLLSQNSGESFEKINRDLYFRLLQND